MTGSHNPNFPPHPSSPEESNVDPFRALDQEKIEELRSVQKDILEQEIYGARHKKDPMNPERTLLTADEKEAAYNRATERWNDLNEEYVNSFSNDLTDEERQVLRDRIDNFSLGAMSDTEWTTGTLDEDGNLTQSGQALLQNEHKELIDNYRASRPEASDSSDSGDEEGDEEERRKAEEQAEKEHAEKQKQLTDKLDDARQKLAEASVKRQTSLRAAFSEKSTEDFNNLQAEYDQALIELGKFEEEKLDRESDTERDFTEKNAQVLSFLIGQAKLLREANNKEWKSTTIGKTAEFFSRGNLPVRIGKSALAGFAVTGVLAVGTSLVAGTGGMAVAAAGTLAAPTATAATAARLFRSYAAARGRKEGMVTDFSGERVNELKSAMGTEMDKAHELGAAHLRELFEEDIRGEQLKDRKSIKIALATAALGPAGVVLAEAGAGFFDFHPFEAIHDKLAGLFDKKTAIKTPGPQSGHTSSPDVNGHHGSGGHHTGGGKHVGGGAHFSGHDLEAFDIAPGEGGFQLMHDLGHGLNNHDWLKMQDHLLEKHPHDFYRMPDGNVGLAHPGNLSRGAMKSIASYWREKHGLAA